MLDIAYKVHDISYGQLGMQGNSREAPLSHVYMILQVYVTYVRAGKVLLTITYVMGDIIKVNGKLKCTF